MSRSSRQLLLVFLPVLAGLILILFWEAITGIPKQISLWSLDGSPLYPSDFGTQTWRGLTGQAWDTTMLGTPGALRVFQPDDLLRFTLPPLIYHLASWLGAFLLITIATLYFLHSYGIKGLRAAIPALALGFSGYTFTLISAGHRGNVMTTGYAVLAMGLVRNGIRRGTIGHLVFAALACVYGIARQMDVMGFFLILIAAYALMQLVLHRHLYKPAKKGATPRDQDDTPESHGLASSLSKSAFIRSIRGQQYPLAKLVVAVVLAALIFGAVGLPFFTSLKGGALQRREQQLEQSGGNQWEFITNWSMPPEQVLELIAPSVFGCETASKERPYWGRLGQSMNWPETKQGFRNFRQHNLYIGGIQITLAIYALFLLLRPGDSADGRHRRTEITFWWVVALVTLLLAFGRYFPLYRLVFQIPVLNKIRCPVKWLHLTEISVVVLMAFGLQGLWQDLKKKTYRVPRRFALGTSIMAGILLLASGVAQSTAFGLQSHWNAIGLGAMAPTLRTGMAGSLLHAALVFGALSAVLWFVSSRALRSAFEPDPSLGAGGVMGVIRRTAPLTALLLILAIDIAVAHKPFIHVRDVSAYYAPNPIADIVLGHQPPVRLADYLTSRRKHDPLWRNMTMKGIDMLLPGAGAQPSAALQTLTEALADSPVRLWEITATRFIMGRRDQLAPLLRHPNMRERATFRITPDARFVLDPDPSAPCVLIENRTALPRAYVHYSARMTPDEAGISKLLSSPNWDPRQHVITLDKATESLDSSLAPGPARVVEYRPGSYDIEALGAAPCIVLLAETSHPRLQPSTGTRVTCNGMMYGILLDQGETSLHVGLQPSTAAMVSLATQGITLVFAVFWLAARCLLRVVNTRVML